MASNAGSCPRSIRSLGINHLKLRYKLDYLCQRFQQHFKKLYGEFDTMNKNVFEESLKRENAEHIRNQLHEDFQRHDLSKMLVILIKYTEFILPRAKQQEQFILKDKMEILKALKNLRNDLAHSLNLEIPDISYTGCSNLIVRAAEAYQFGLKTLNDVDTTMCTC